MAELIHTMVATYNHLPDWLQRALLASGPVRVTFSDSGYVLVDPNQHRYASDIKNWAAPSRHDASAVQITPLPGATAAQDDLPISHLHWVVTLGGLQGQPQASYEFRFSLLRLISWPSLTHLPEPIIPTVARICALLARKPTAASLIPLMLGMSEEQVFPVIETLRLNQHIQISGSSSESSTGAAPQGATLPSDQESRPAENSLIGKLWQRLVMVS